MKLIKTILKNKLKIAIYSGTIPSTPFIENLINGIAVNHMVYVFGKQIRKASYSSNNVRVFPIRQNKFLSVLITFLKTFQLLIKYPRRLKVLIHIIQSHKGFYKKYNWWGRYVPVLLNLPDIFHVQWAKDLEKWFFLKEYFGCKIVLSLRGAHINYSPIANDELAVAYRKYFPKVDAFHAVSDAIGKEAQKYGASLTKIRTIHSLIAKPAFDLPKEVNNNLLNIISVGRHHWKKGYNVSLDSCKILKELKIPFTYTIVAAGKVPEELLFQRNQLELVDEVMFIGGMSQKEVFKKVQESDVFLLSSLEEGIANVVLEAMVLGTLVVSTNCGGMAEVIHQGETGWLVPVRNPEAIANALVEVNKSSLEKCQEIVKNAHSLVKEQFNSELVIKEFNKFYEGVYNK